MAPPGDVPGALRPIPAIDVPWDAPAVEFLVVLALILVHGLFVMARTALDAASRSRLTERSGQGDRGAAVALGLVQNPGAHDSAIQLVLSFIAILVGAYSLVTITPKLRGFLERLDLVGDSLDWLSLALTAAAAAGVLVVLGEVAPRRLALDRPELYASLAARPIMTLAILLRPATATLSSGSRLITRILGVRGASQPLVSQEQIEVLVHEGARTGVFDDEEHELIKRVFRFSDRRARTIMTPRNDIVWLDPADSPDEIRRKVTSSTHAQFPVCDQSLDNLLGIVRAKDFLTEGLEIDRFRVHGRLAMPLFIYEGTRGLKIVSLFKKSPVRIAVVLDEYGAVQGLLTLTDLLEAIVGDMPASEETEEPKVVERDDGSWLLDGRMPLDEFRELLGLATLPTGDYHTLAGLVVTHLGRIPGIAEHFELADLRFEIVDMDGNRVDRVLVERLGNGGSEH